MVTSKKNGGHGGYAAVTLASRVNNKRIKSSLTDRIKGLKSPSKTGSPSRIDNPTPLLQAARRNLLSSILPSSSVRSAPHKEVTSRPTAGNQQLLDDAPYTSKIPFMRGKSSLFNRLQQHKSAQTPSRFAAGSSKKDTALANAAFTFVVPSRPAGTSKKIDDGKPQELSWGEGPAPRPGHMHQHRGGISKIAAPDETAAAMAFSTERLGHALQRRTVPIHATAPAGASSSSSQFQPGPDAGAIRSIGRQGLMSLLADVQSNGWSSVSTSQHSGRGTNDSSFDSTTLLDLKSLNLAAETDNTSRVKDEDEHADKHEAESKQVLHRAKDIKESLAAELERSVAEEIKSQDESSRVAYQRITHLVRGFVTISEALHNTFQAAVSRNVSFEKDVAELSDVMAAAHIDVLEQMGQTVEKIRDVIGSMRKEQERYEAQRSEFLSSFRKKAKAHFGKYEAERDELFKVAAAVNDTKASEKQVRSTVMSLIQSL